MRYIGVTIAIVAIFACGDAAAKSEPKPAVAIDHDNWIRPGDFPREGIPRRAHGAVEFQIAINPSGYPENCVIRQSSGFDMLDKATCQLILKRARFHPATDENGEPTEGGYRDRVIWKAR
ncbi:MAG TPA: energy transducer TonB [Sphingomonadaceae bacterium]